MSGKSSRDKYLPYALHCAALGYRFIPKDARWLAPDGSVDPAMFYRKSHERDGVSLTTTIGAGLGIMAKNNRAVEGVRSLHVGWVRDIEPINTLDVRSNHSTSVHAAITGLPFEDDNLRESERFANSLLEISRPEKLSTTS